MKTLTIIPGMHETIFKLAGFSLKAMGMDSQDFYKSDCGHWCINNDFKQDGRTATISTIELIKCIKLIHDNIPFSKIKIVGTYEMTGDELMAIVTRT